MSALRDGDALVPQRDLDAMTSERDAWRDLAERQNRTIEALAQAVQSANETLQRTLDMARESLAANRQ